MVKLSWSSKSLPPTVEKRLLRKNIFHSTGTVHGQKCTIVIGGSCENINSQTFVDCLKLKVYKHNRPYFVKWLMTGDEAQVRHLCQVTFAIGDDYKDTIWCDVLPMDSGDKLLVRHTCQVTFAVGDDYKDTIWCDVLPMDSVGTHGMRDNTYTFMHGGKEVTLHPKKPNSPKRRSKAHATKEVLHVYHLYRGNLKKTRVRGLTLLSTGSGGRG